MTVDDVFKMKDKLEVLIATEIYHFEKQTGCKITAVHLFGAKRPVDFMEGGRPYKRAPAGSTVLIDVGCH